MLVHSTDTIPAYKTGASSSVGGGQGHLTVQYLGPPGFKIAKKKLYPVPDSQFTDALASVMQLPPDPANPGQLRWQASVEMAPGEVSIIGVFEHGFPNEEAQNQLTVACIAQPNESPIGLVDLKVTPGGTFCAFGGRTPTQPPNTRYFIRLWVHTNENEIVDPSVRAPLVRAHNLEPRELITDQQMALDIVPLVPGTTYFYNYQIIGPNGESNQPKTSLPSFQTKSRTVDVRVGELRVKNDGDDGFETGEAEFRVIIFKDGTGIKVWKLGTDDNPITVDDRVYPLATAFVNLAANFPPEPGDYKVGINAHGREFDLQDELATSGASEYDLLGPWYIPYKKGRDEVNDVDQKYTLPVPSLGRWQGAEQESFAFEVDVEYSVRYI
jgi:hypothetical protein